MKRVAWLLLVLTLTACAGTIPPTAKRVGIVSFFGDEIYYDNHVIPIEETSIDDIRDWKLNAFTANQMSSTLISDGYDPVVPQIATSAGECSLWSFDTPRDRLKRLLGNLPPNVDVWIYIERDPRFGCSMRPVTVDRYGGILGGHSNAAATILAMMYVFDGHDFHRINMTSFFANSVAGGSGFPSIRLRVPDYPRQWSEVDGVHRDEVLATIQKEIAASAKESLKRVGL